MIKLNQKQIDSFQRLALDNIEQMIHLFENNGMFDKRYYEHVLMAKDAIDTLEEGLARLYEFNDESYNNPLPEEYFEGDNRDRTSSI